MISLYQTIFYYWDLSKGVKAEIKTAYNCFNNTNYNGWNNIKWTFK